jgi:hypothetical protein
MGVIGVMGLRPAQALRHIQPRFKEQDNRSSDDAAPVTLPMPAW